MAAITRIFDGDSLQYTPAADTVAGTLVDLGGFYGVTVAPIKAGVTGAVATSGQFIVAKSGSSGPIFSVGEIVYFNRTSQLATKGGLDCIPIGPCTVAAATGDTTVRCLLIAQLHPVMYGKIFKDVSLAGGSYTVVEPDGGQVLNVTVGHASNVITLPAAASAASQGWDIVVRLAFAGGALAVIIQPVALDLISIGGVLGVDNKQLIMAAGSAKVGDYVRLSATVNGWCATAFQGSWTKQP